MTLVSRRDALPRAATTFAIVLVFSWSARSKAESAKPLFPTPFVVEHRMVQTGSDGEEYHTETVTDTYGGSWLVSARANGTRTVVDFARREVMEIDPSKGTYWVLSFSRMAELRDRLERAEGGAPAKRSAPTAAAAPKATIRVEESDESATRGARPAPLGRASVRHLRAFSEPGTAGVDVWVDGAVRLSAEAREALLRFESDALGAATRSAAEPTVADLIDAVREKTNGAFPVRTRRPVAASDAAAGLIEDEVTRLETLPAFPQKLVAAGPGFRRIASPLETMVAFAEDDAALRAAGNRR